jgi:hypothetical protein
MTQPPSGAQPGGDQSRLRTDDGVAFVPLRTCRETSPVSSSYPCEQSTRAREEMHLRPPHLVRQHRVGERRVQPLLVRIHEVWQHTVALQLDVSSWAFHVVGALQPHRFTALDAVRGLPLRDVSSSNDNQYQYQPCEILNSSGAPRW